mmetsp:Transcript_6757/g.6024  ORF Transcript_6757/g.6024 Transcript_6757/m.6024 type:complete len:522 (+) Transcript_6757:1-1566(+)
MNMNMNRNNRRNMNRNNRRRGRHIPKSASLNALSFITSPRPNGVPDRDRGFVYNLTQRINDISQERQSLNGRRLNTTNPSHSHSHIANKPNPKQFRNENKKRTQKRRIRTFYSKKWGNRLYNLREQNNDDNNNNNMPQTIRSHSCDIPDMLRADRYQQQQQQSNSSQLQLWQNEVCNARRSLSAFIEEENLDLNDIKSPRSVSPSASPMPMHLGVDFRMNQDSQTVYYDSAASNIASNTDMESDGDEDDEDEDDIECTPTPSPNPNGPIHRDFTPTPAPNLGYNDRSSSNLRISRYNDDENESEIEMEMGMGMEKPSSSNFKIIVSAPNNEDHTNYNHSQTLNDRQNELMSRLKPKRSRRRYIPSVIESGASDDCSSCDDDDDVTTGNEMDDDDLYNKSSLFLSENNLQRGVYASFGFSDTETDYLSAQSDDFDELTICYHHRNDRDRNNNLSVNNNHNEGKNIRFRNHLNDANYLSDIGPSDIGSSDTECFSSNDSIPDSIPPPLHHDDDDIDDDFVSIN